LWLALTSKKIGCASSGLCGNTKLVEGGGEPFNHDTEYNRSVHFYLERMAGLAGAGEGTYIQGAAAACPAQLGGHCGELVPSLVVGGDNNTRAVRVGQQGDCIVQEDNTRMCGGISNLFLCDGSPGPVISLEVSTRIGQQPSLTQCIREALAQVPGVGGDKELGLGGVFRMKTGTVKAHVQPDLEVLPHKYYDNKQMKCVKDFLQFYSFPAPLLCFTCLWTKEPQTEGPTLNLRGSGEHTHFWREDDGTAGGHYHGDTDPTQVSYSGYFNLASELVRVWDAYQQREQDN